jgi:hypothetical protein
MPKATDYSGDDRKAFQRGRAAGQRYYRAINAGKVITFHEIIERADARDELGAWYDGINSVCNPEYFTA